MEPEGVSSCSSFFLSWTVSCNAEKLTAVSISESTGIDRKIESFKMPRVIIISYHIHMGCALKILFVMQADVDCPVHHSLNLSARFWQLSKTASCTTSGHFAENKGVQLKKSSATQALLMPLGRCQAVPAGIYPPKLPFLSGKMMIIQLNFKCRLFFRHMMVFVQETLLWWGSNPQISSCISGVENNRVDHA